MDQRQQQRPQEPTVRGRPFPPGVSPNPHGRPTKAQRLEQLRAKMAELAVRFGGLEVLDSIELERIRLAATLILRSQNQRANDYVRLINSADRLLARVEKSRRCKPRPVSPASPNDHVNLSHLIGRAPTAPAAKPAKQKPATFGGRRYTPDF
jgi:hypothetical protein